MPVQSKIPNERIQICEVCLRTKFSLFKRRHLCNNCGKTICASCSVEAVGSSLFRKRDLEEANVCVICKHSMTASRTAQSSPPVASTPVHADPNTTTAAAKTSTAAAPSGTSPPPPRIPDPPPPPPAVEATPPTAPVAVPPPRTEPSQSATVASSVLSESSSLPPAHDVDWGASTCPDCGRSYTLQRRRTCCTKCRTTVCADCLGAHICSTAAGRSIPPFRVLAAAQSTSASASAQVPPPAAPATATATAAATMLPVSLLGTSMRGAGGFGGKSFASKATFQTGRMGGGLPNNNNNNHGTANQHPTFAATSFRPTSMLRKTTLTAAVPTSAAAAPINDAAPAAAPVVGSVAKSFRKKGADSGNAVSAAIDVQSTANSFVLGTTPMGSLPPQFLAARRLVASAGAQREPSLFQQFLTYGKTWCGEEGRNWVWIAEANGPFAKDHFEACLSMLTERHPLLRTSILPQDGGAPLLNVFPATAADFRLLTASTGSREAMDTLLVNELSKPFDFSKGTTLFRVRVIRYPAEKPGQPSTRHTIGIALHESIASPTAFRLLLDDLRVLYQNAYQIITVDGGLVTINHELIQRLLPRSPQSFEEFCEEERASLVDPAASLNQKQFWAERVAQRVPCEFPTDRPRAGDNLRPLTARHSFLITPAIFDGLAAWSRSSSVAMSTCFLSAFSLAVLRYSNQDALSVAVLHNLQQGASNGFTDTLGPLLNYGVYNVPFQAEWTCTRLAQAVSSMLHEAEAYRDYPFVKMAQDAGVAWNTQRFPLADVSFTYDNSDVGSFLFGVEGSITQFAGLELRSTSKFESRRKRRGLFSLSLHVWEHRGRAYASIEYDTHLWDASTMQRFVENFLYMLRFVAAGDGERYTVSNVPLLSPKQSQQLLYTFNQNTLVDTETWISRGCGVQGFVADAVSQYPDRVALAMPEQGSTLTYRELDEQSNMIAQLLSTDYGVEPGRSVVAVAMPRCTTQMVCVLGILKSGAAYLPLDLSYPAERLDFMLHDSNVACVFTAQSVMDGPLEALFKQQPGGPPPPPAVPIMEHFHTLVAERFQTMRQQAPSVWIDSEFSTYVIYTSGSTGKPKGVVMNHRALLNLVLWQNHYLTVRQPLESVHALQFSPISFDVSFQELFTTWSLGGTLFMVSEALRLDPQRLVRFLNEHTIHRLFLPFVALSHLCENAIESGEFPTSLTDIITAGEQLVISRPLVECLQHLASQNIILHNHYGPSETHVCSYAVLEGDPKSWLVLPPIGKPISNTQLYVCDDKLQLVPIGVIGELYIAGDCLGTGYLGREDATKLAFVDCPFPSASSRLMYKTGDLVQMLPDGNLLYVRRKDTQVKFRGFRIELGEIEARLAVHEAVKKCCVVVYNPPGALDSNSNQKKLVAYLVLDKHFANGEVAAAKSALREYLKGQIPDYMIPSVFVVLPSLPLTPSGKINRKGLPPPTDDDIADIARAQSRGQQAPTTLTEQMLAKIWESVLQTKVLSVEANFFDLGGHSLSITKVSSRVSAKLNVEIPLTLFFDNPTLLLLARAIDEHVTNESRKPAAAVVPVTFESPFGDDSSRFPLTYNQQSMVFLCVSRPDSAAVYNIAMQGILVGDISIPDLTNVFEQVLKACPSLRTTYHQDRSDGSFYQIVTNNTEVDFNVVDCSGEEDEYGHDRGSAPAVQDDFEDEGFSSPAAMDRQHPSDRVHSSSRSAAGSVFVADEPLVQLLRDEANRPFDLAADSLMRVRLYQRSGGAPPVLQLVFHHVAVDLWSIDLILDEVVGQMGGSRLISRESFSTGKRGTYLDYARYQQAMFESGSMSRSAAAWKSLLGLSDSSGNSGPRELPVLDFPTDFPRPLSQTFHGDVHVFDMPASLAEKLQSLIVGRSSTMYCALLSVLFTLLHKYTRQEEIVIGTPMACRNVERFEQTVGYFINAIPVLQSLGREGQTMSDLLDSCRHYLQQALEHQAYPFPLIADTVVGARTSGRSPVFQVLFTYQAAPMRDEIAPFIMFKNGGEVQLGPKAKWESLAVPTGHAMYDLVFQFAQVPATRSNGKATLTGTVEYNTDLFQKETIERLTEMFIHVAEQMCDSNGSIAIQRVSTAPRQAIPTLVDTFNSKFQPTSSLILGPGVAMSLDDEQRCHFPELLRLIAEKYPGKEALSFGYPSSVAGGTGVRTMTFRELDQVTDALASQLVAQCGGTDFFAPDAIVGVSIRRSIEMILAMIAVMKVSAAYVPLDPSYPAERLQYMIENSGAKVVICRAEDNGLFTSSDASQPVVLHIERLMEAATAAVSATPDAMWRSKGLAAHHLAYVIYTSGSTGKPKGTLLQHRGLVNLVYSIQKAYCMQFGQSRFLLFASSSFDASALEIFATLGNACTVVMLAESTLVGEQLSSAMSALNVTTAVLPPSVLSVMTDETFPSRGLKVLVTAGEAINDELLARWRSKVHMLNAYGPTENTVCSTVCDYDAEGVILLPTHAQVVAYRQANPLPLNKKALIVKAPPIGRPIPNYCCYVLDSCMQPVGLGVPGELVVTSPGVARGYHGLPERTAQSFMENPFPTHRRRFPVVYRTGDLVRWLDGGLLEFLGRIDGQVKLRGYRIELGEIESVIMKFGTAILDCAVDIRTLATGKALVGYLVVRKDATPPTIAELKSHIRKHTPEYMVPSVFVTLDHLPLSPSGKVDRKALPTPSDSQQENEDDAVDKRPPQTATESVLLLLTKEVLGSQRVAITDDFFDAGGHSLAAMQLLSRVQDHLGVDVPIAKLFEIPRLTELAKYIDQVKQVNEPVIPLEHNEFDDADRPTFPLSFNQEALWYAFVLDPSRASFNVAFAAEVTSSVNIAALTKALHTLAMLHPMLRTKYTGEDAATPQQMVVPTTTLIAVNEEHWSEEDRSSPLAQRELIEEICHRPLALNEGQVMRATYFLGPEETLTHFVLLFHHIVSDLVSMEVVITQLGQLYQAAITAGSLLADTPLSAITNVDQETSRALSMSVFGATPSITYIDFLFYQRQMIASQKGERLLAYWQRHLSGYPASTNLPTDFTRPAHPSGKGGAAVATIAPSLVESVLTSAKSMGVTPLNVYLAALYAWLSRVTGQHDLVVGMPMSSRTRGDLEQVVGDFVNLCPLRVQLDAEDAQGEHATTFRQLAKHAQQALLGALTNQDYPFQLLVQRLQQYRDASRSPIFQVLLVHEKPHHTMRQLSPFVLGDGGGTLALAGGALTLQSVPMAEHTCEYDLVFAVSEGEGNRVDFRLQYATDLFSHKTAQRFSEQYLALLQAAVAAPHEAVNKLSLMSASVSAAVQSINEQTAHPQVYGLSSFPPSATEGFAAVDAAVDALPIAFEKTAARYPDTLALHDTLGHRFTYRQVNARANVVAAAIVSEIKPTREKSLCVLLPRSVEYVLAILAAAKSGITYTPIDIKVPQDRKEYIIRDAGAQFLLTCCSLKDELAPLLANIPPEELPVVLYIDAILEEAVNASSFDEDASWQDNVRHCRPSGETIGLEKCMYMIYTSGSTGKPKGTMVHHGGVLNVCRWFVAAHQVTVGDVSAQALGAAFDPVTVELWPYLISGASVVIMDDNSKFGGPEATLSFLVTYEVTHLTFPTVLSQLILDTTEVFPAGLRVRSWSCGGDTFRGSNRDLPFSLINAYGPTECCVLCSQYPVNYDVVSRDAFDGQCHAPESGRKSVNPPLGRPTFNTALYVLDEYGNQVPPGVVGELCVGGAQVGIGYRHRDEATAAAFVTDPFRTHACCSMVTPARMYRTGDLVKMDDDYDIHFVGRKDFQVKIRGFRIELGEVEAQLAASSESVRRAVVIAASDPTRDGEKRLEAYVQIDESAKADAVRIRQEMVRRTKGKLPDYMIPALIVLLPQFPLTANGKVDRVQLPLLASTDLCGTQGLLAAGAATASTAAGGSGGSPPVTKEEKTMCGIWEELLHVKDVGLHDNWYDRGGTSLTSTMLLSRMRQVFQMEVSIQQFFVDPTVQGLLKIVKEKGNIAVAHSLVDVLEADASNLDEQIAAHEAVGSYDPQQKIQNIFLTGVTGFLGAFLLHEMLVSTNAMIFCLVRAKTDADASARIFKNLEAYRLLQDPLARVDLWMDRIIPVVGDLAQEHFGLSVTRFHELAQVIDVIIHNGALVNFSYPYVSLKAANVTGTVTGLRLATLYRLKPFHFVSTLSTVPDGDQPGSRVVSERLLGVANESLHGGYTQTKWVAERLVTLAGQRGVPVTIIRPGRITGHSVSGACNHDDFLNLFIKGCIQMRAAPSVDMPCEMTPVDFCAKAIRLIMEQHFVLFSPSDPSWMLGNRFIYHLTNLSAISWREVMRIAAEKCGYTLCENQEESATNDRAILFLPYAAWRANHLLQLNNESHCSLIPLVPMFGPDFEEEVKPMEVQIDHLTALLRGVTCPLTNEPLVSVYIRYFLEVGFLTSYRQNLSNNS